MCVPPRSHLDLKMKTTCSPRDCVGGLVKMELWLRSFDSPPPHTPPPMKDTQPFFLSVSWFLAVMEYDVGSEFRLMTQEFLFGADLFLVEVVDAH